MNVSLLLFLAYGCNIILSRLKTFKPIFSSIFPIFPVLYSHAHTKQKNENQEILLKNLKKRP